MRPRHPSGFVTAVVLPFLRTSLSLGVREEITETGIVGVPLRGWGEYEFEKRKGPRGRCLGGDVCRLGNSDSELGVWHGIRHDVQCELHDHGGLDGHYGRG